jgi:predicted nucleic acid-binding protein
MPKTSRNTASYKWQLVERPDDNKFVDCAVGVNADYLVSDDKHGDLLKLKIYFPVPIVTFQQFKSLGRT